MAKLNTDKIDFEMNAFGKSVVRRARGNLTRSKSNASKQLWNSIKYKYENGVLSFSMADYGPFVDQGVTGTGKGNYTPRKPRTVARSLSTFKFTKGPVGPDAKKSFRSWAATRNILVRDELGRFVTPAAANFMLRRSVGRFGIKPTRFFSDAWDRAYPIFEKKIGPIITDGIANSIDEILADNLKQCNT